MATPAPPLGLGEVVLRVRDLDGMQRFYQEVFGLEPALPRTATDVQRTTLHHFALEIPGADHAAWKARLEAHGLVVTTAEHRWVDWRSLYVADPEGNVVELVCHDPGLGP